MLISKLNSVKDVFLSIYARHLSFVVYYSCTKYFSSLSATKNFFYLCFLIRKPLFLATVFCFFFVNSREIVSYLYRVLVLIFSCLYRVIQTRFFEVPPISAHISKRIFYKTYNYASHYKLHNHANILLFPRKVKFFLLRVPTLTACELISCFILLNS